MKKHTILISIAILIILILFVINPTVSIQSSLAGISVWATNLLPALFPFFVFTKLLNELGFITYLSKALSPITKKLYNTGGISGYIYLMSVMSGYPVGAKLTADLFEKKIISSGEAHRIISFTSTSGPIFILGTVAIGMFNSWKLGIIILLSHFIGALINGLIFRRYKLKTVSSAAHTVEPNQNMLENVLFNSIKSIVLIGAYVSIFFVLITMLNHYNIFLPITNFFNFLFPTLNTNVTNSVLNGLVELTRGCLDLSKLNLTFASSAMLLTTIISFGGICVNMQAITFLKKINVSLKFFAFQKITHTLISVCLCALICLFV